MKLTKEVINSIVEEGTIAENELLLEALLREVDVITIIRCINEVVDSDSIEEIVAQLGEK